jgi:hypothetical protein
MLTPDATRRGNAKARPFDCSTMKCENNIDVVPDKRARDAQRR